MEIDKIVEIPFYYQLPPIEALEAQLHNLGVAEQNRATMMQELVELEVAANSLRRALDLDEKEVTYIPAAPRSEEIDKLIQEREDKERSEAIAQIESLDLSEGVRHEVRYKEYVDLEMSAYTNHFTYAIHRQDDTVLVEFRHERSDKRIPTNSVTQYVASPSLDQPLIIKYTNGAKPSTLGLELDKSSIGYWRNFSDVLKTALEKLEDQASLLEFMQLLENTDIVDGKFYDEKLRRRTFDLGNGLCYEIAARYHKGDNRNPTLTLTEIAIVKKLDGNNNEVTRMDVRELTYETWPNSYNRRETSEKMRANFLANLKTIQALSGSPKPSNTIE